MITTKETNTTAKELFLILLVRYLKKKWWLIIWCLSLAIYFFVKETKSEFDSYMLLFFISYPLIIPIFFWRQVKSKKNPLFLKSRTYEIDEEKLVCSIDENTNSTISIKHFTKFQKIRNHYLLYISKDQFIYIPFECFKSNADKTWFKETVLSQIN